MVRFLGAFITVMLTGYLAACSAINPEVVNREPVEGLNGSPQHATSESVMELNAEQSAESEGGDGVLGVEEESRNPSANLTVWHGMVDNEILIFGDIVNSFQRQNPGIQVNLIYIPYDDLHNRYIDAANSGQGPSMMMGAGEWGPSLYEIGLAADLTRLDISGSMIMPSAIESVTHQGVIYGMPITASGHVMYRNNSMIPERPRTFDDLISFAQAVPQGESIGAYLEGGGLFALPQLTACGGELMLENGFPAFNNKAGYCWIELLQSYEEAGPVSYNGDDDLNRFMDGKVGIIFEGTWNMRSLSENLGENLNIDTWPQYDEAYLSGYIWTENVYINPALDESNMNAALKFTEHLLSPDSQKLLAKIGLVPVRMDLVGLPPLMSQAALALSGCAPFPSDPVVGTYLQVFNDILKVVYNYQISPPDALKTAAEQIIKATKDFENPGDDF